MSSLLRYPGGKAKIYNTVKNIIVSNYLSQKVYVEPFSGGFGLGIKLMQNNDISKFIINDYDKHIYAFWRCVFKHTNKLIQKIATTEITITEWYKQKSIYDNYKKHSIIDIGFSTLFLNRTNFSGILMSGPIGGFSQIGKYKLDCRFNKESIIKQIKTLAKYKDKVEIYNKDAIKLIEILKPREQELFYNFDPPYVNKGQKLYLNAYVEQDHTDLSIAIKNLKSKWIMTYDNVSLIKGLYSDYCQKEFDLTYSVKSKKKENQNMNKEIMITNLKQNVA